MEKNENNRTETSGKFDLINSDIHELKQRVVTLQFQNYGITSVRKKLEVVEGTSLSLRHELSTTSGRVVALESCFDDVSNRMRRNSLVFYSAC